MYIEATGQNPNDTAEIMSDSYPSAIAGHCFTLWYHMYGADVGTLNIFQVFGNNRYFLWGMKGDRGNVWKKTQITIKNSAQYTVSIILGRPQRVEKTFFRSATAGTEQKILTVKCFTYRIYSKYQELHTETLFFNYRNLAVDIK